MLDYLKQAFWAGPSLPGLGRLPVNALAVLAFAIFGFAHPGFWLLGTGLEAAYLASLVTHPRFQRLVNAQQRNQVAAEAEQGRQELIRSLDLPSRQRLITLEGKRGRILDLARDALNRLLWIYLKLLVARRQLAATKAQTNTAELEQKASDLEKGLAAGSLPTALRDSQTATLKLLRQRLENLERCDENLKQVDSDLARVEAQVDLAAESAALRGGGAAVTANLELASQTLD